MIQNNGHDEILLKPSDDAMRQRIVPVIVLNWNGLDDTVACVEALLDNRGVNFRVILVDNGSDGDDCRQLSKRFGNDARIDVRRNRSNLGFARGVNEVLRELMEADRGARPEYVALLNNDAVPERDWLATLVRRADVNGAAAVTSRMLRFDDPEIIDNAGHVFLNTGEVLPRGAGEPARHYAQPADVLGACAGACLYRLSVLSEVGVFDEFFETGYEDADLGLRIFLAGHDQVFEPEAIVRHRISASIDKIRNIRYAVRLQVNVNYTYLKLMPAAVIVWNSPWLALKTVALLTVPALLGRWRLLGVQWRAFARTLALLPGLGSIRARAGRRSVSAVAVIARQEWFASRYMAYLRRIWSGEKTIFER